MKKIKRKSNGKREYDNSKFNTIEPEDLYFKFNFTYFNFPKRMSKEHQAQLLLRMVELSRERFVHVMHLGKSNGFEIENIKIEKAIPSEFVELFPAKAHGKFTIIRLYPNNNPVVARVVGILIKKTLYIFWLFFDDDGYKH